VLKQAVKQCVFAPEGRSSLVVGDGVAPLTDKFLRKFHPVPGRMGIPLGTSVTRASKLLKILEARDGIEPAHKGFADLPRHIMGFWRFE
jgi:hypothetical protein